MAAKKPKGWGALPSGRVKVSVSLDAELHRRLGAYARGRNLTTSAVVEAWAREGLKGFSISYRGVRVDGPGGEGEAA